MLGGIVARVYHSSRDIDPRRPGSERAIQSTLSRRFGRAKCGRAKCGRAKCGCTNATCHCSLEYSRTKRLHIKEAILPRSKFTKFRPVQDNSVTKFRPTTEHGRKNALLEYTTQDHWIEKLHSIATQNRNKITG